MLSKEGINYSLQDGEIMLRLPLNSDITYVENVLTGDNIMNLKFGKEGLVSLPKEFILDNRVVPIRNNEKFDAVLGMDRKVGDKINVSVNTLSFGEQIIAFSASEVKEGNQ
jgi:hypothetical protein